VIISVQSENESLSQLSANCFATESRSNTSIHFRHLAMWLVYPSSSYSYSIKSTYRYVSRLSTVRTGTKNTGTVPLKQVRETSLRRMTNVGGSCTHSDSMPHSFSSHCCILFYLKNLPPKIFLVGAVPTLPRRLIIC
jgi:hypothetical protein